MKEVAAVLALLEGKGATETTTHVVSLAEEIVQVARHEAELESSWREVLTNTCGARTL